MTVDLAEERSTANMATERLEAETAERLRLEKELSEKENKVKSLQETTEKLEMELICAKSDLNGISLCFFLAMKTISIKLHQGEKKMQMYN